MASLGTILRTFLRCFLAGVVAVLPLIITVGAVIWVAGYLSSMLGPSALLGKALKSLGLQFARDSTPAIAYLFGWIFVLTAIFALGVLVEMGAKRLVQGSIDGLAKRVPLLGGVYGTARQLVGMIGKKDDADLKGMSVVFCAFGADTGAAFLALLPTPEAFQIGEVSYHAIIIPSAPVPVGGSLIFVPTSSVRRADISVDALMSIYVSMGVTGPQFLPCVPG